MSFSDSMAQPEEMSTNGSNGCLSPDRTQQVNPTALPRPLSPDSPEIISELQRYTGGTAAAQTEGAAENSKVAQTNCSSSGNVVQPKMDATAAQDLRTGSKRKASTPSLEERPSKQPPTGKHSLAPPQGFPFSGGYSLPPLGLNPALLGGSLGHPLFMGAGSPYFQPPNSQLSDPSCMYPDLFGFGGAGAAPTSSSSSSPTTSTATATSSSSSLSSSASIKAATSVPGALPPFMLSPSMAGMAGMLPPGFPLSYNQSLASLYAGSMLPGGLPGPAATPGPAGASFLSQFPPTTASCSSSSSPSSFSPSAQSEGTRGPVLVNGRNVSSPSGSEDDDDVIEVSGQ